MTSSLMINVVPVEEIAPACLSDFITGPTVNNPTTGGTGLNGTDGDETVATFENTATSGNVIDAGLTSVDGAIRVMGFTVDGIVGAGGVNTVFFAGETATIAGVGTLTIGADGAYSFTPDLNYIGPVPVGTYTINDGQGTETSMLTVTVVEVIDEDETVSTLEDTATSGNVIDTSLAGKIVTVIGFEVDTGNDGSADEGFSAGDSATIAGVGTLTIGADGACTFTPIADYNGSVPVVTYTLSQGGSLETSTLTITVDAVVDIAADTASTDEDTAVTTNALTNDSFEGTPVVSVEVGDEPSNGSVVVNGDGTITYTPDANFTGEDQYTYTVTSGGVTETQTVTLTVAPVTDLVAVADIASGDEDTVISGNVSSNDTTLSGGALSFAEASAPANGLVAMNPDGSYTYTPNANFTGEDSFTYTVTDAASGEQQTQTVTLTVAPVNQPITIQMIVAANVSEAGLALRVGAPSDGTNATGTGEIADGDPNNNSDISDATTGMISFTAGGGLRDGDGVQINGDTATVGASFAGSYGMLTITSISASEINYSYMLTDNGDHSSGAVSETFVVLLTNAGGDTANETLSINILDDAPVDFIAQSMQITNATLSTGSGALNFFESIGADDGTVVFSGGLDGQSMLLADGVTAATVLDNLGEPQTVTLWGYETDALIGRVGSTDGTDGTAVIKISLNPDGSVESNDTYTVELFQALNDGSIRKVDGNDLTGGNSYHRIAEGADNFDVMFSATLADGTPSTVNSSANQIGVDLGPRIENYEILHIDFLNNAFSKGEPFISDGHYNVNAFAFGIGKQNFGLGGKGETHQVVLRAFNANNDSILTNDPQVQIMRILIDGMQ
ncbi:MAG: hypothetical protein ACJAWZ_001524 [Paracoccaceae bacterium]|jgi:hypothetical protein